MKTNLASRNFLIFSAAIVRAANPDVSSLKNSCSVEDSLGSDRADDLPNDSKNQQNSELKLIEQIKDFNERNKANFEEFCDLYNSISVGSAEKQHHIIRNIRDSYPSECDLFVRQIKTPVKEHKFHFASVCNKLNDKLSDQDAKDILQLFDVKTDILNSCYHTLNVYNALNKHLEDPQQRANVFQLTKQLFKDSVEGLEEMPYENLEEGVALLLIKQLKDALEALSKKISVVLANDPAARIFHLKDRHMDFFKGEQEYYAVLGTNIPKLKMIADILIVDAEKTSRTSSSDAKKQ
ncbi:hypothetical protein ENBRE01_0312 [Enteropsectra breve]|nr:hypothetical protein ENBRE01_0312 [Enteropsectra breve]